MLLNFFQKKYSSIIEAKVISDPVTKISKGYGFLRFSQQTHATTCISEFQGHYILTKPIKLNNAAQRKTQER
jgi:RNA recognition motif-containing protein